MYDDFGGIDIGIDPSSIDYSSTLDGGSLSGMSNAQIEDSWMIPELEDYTFAPEGGGALQITQSEGGSPNVGSPTAEELSSAGGKEDDSMGLKKLASAVGLTKKDGSMDLDKIVKIGLGLGGAYSSYMKNKAAGDSQRAQTAAQLQQSLQRNVNNNWTPQQSQWASRFLDTPVNPNRGLAIAGQGGIKSIQPGIGYAGGGLIRGALKDMPRAIEEVKNLIKGAKATPPRKISDAEWQAAEDAEFFRKNPDMRPPGWKDPAENYAQGGGIGYLGDERYGNTPLARTAPASRTENIFERVNRRREEDAGLRGPAEILQPLNRPTRTTEMYGVREILEALPKLLSGAGQDYAEGGDIHRPEQGAFGMIAGAGDGQSDSIPINAADGEYMVDAESVSMLGNGSNEAGARILDEWRQRLREHKRSADVGDIAPPTGEEHMPPLGAQ